MFAYASAKTELKQLKLQGPRPPESVIAYLRSLRRTVTVKEAAKIIARHPETFYRLIATGLPAAKSGRTWRIDPIRLADWLEEQDHAPAVVAQPKQAPERSRA